MPDDLVNEVTALTEWPVVYESGFDEEFLTVPVECLILTMQQNQKYFALKDQNKKLMNRFLLVSQIEAQRRRRSDSFRQRPRCSRSFGRCEILL